MGAAKPAAVQNGGIATVGGSLGCRWKAMLVQKYLELVTSIQDWVRRGERQEGSQQSLTFGDEDRSRVGYRWSKEQGRMSA